MYIRFVTGLTDPDTGLEEGIFQSAADVLYGYWITESWLRTEILRSLDWFNEHLERPSRLNGMSRRRRGQFGMCWFRPEARHHIREAHHMAWLISEAGRPTRLVRAVHPGEIVWRDDHQLVAVPNRSGPVFL